MSQVRALATHRPATLARALLWTLILTLACARVAAQAWECPWTQAQSMGAVDAAASADGDAARTGMSPDGAPQTDCLMHCLGDKSPSPGAAHAMPGPATPLAVHGGKRFAWPLPRPAAAASHEHSSSLWLSTQRMRL